jgi:His-Xaa-Ser system protein HxsD
VLRHRRRSQPRRDLSDPVNTPFAALQPHHEIPSDFVRYCVDTSLYSREAIFRACYQFTDRCFLFLEPAGEARIEIEFRKRRPSTDLAEIVGSFANELINQKVRADIARETQVIREQIVAQAFSGADFRGPGA